MRRSLGQLASLFLVAALTLRAGAQIPGVIEAENFDIGGEGIGYHDRSPGNQGDCQYRTGEDVDIFASTDAQGGACVVKNLETGEWLAYAINAPTPGSYDIEVRAATNFDFPSSAFHVEVDGVDVTGSVVLPDSGGWDNYQWLGKRTLTLSAGTHELRIVSDQQYFNLNAIRLSAAPNPAPYTGVPNAIPGTWEAEDFDLGGQDVAYHDSVAGNAGAQYRAGDDVDIIVSADSAGGGYVINDFANGEWLAYTVDVASTGSYDVALRASNQNWSPAPAFHVAIDGVPVEGSTVVPSTGSWTAFAWVAKTGVHLTAGRHVLQIVSDQEYFNLNRVRVTASQPTSPVFRSGFESATTVDPPSDCYEGADPGCFQSLSGADLASGYAWPPDIWQGSNGRFQMIADASLVPDAPAAVATYIVNQIQSGTGRGGGQALHSQIIRSGCCETGPQGAGASQNAYLLEPSGLGHPDQEGDLYVSYWLRFQSNLPELMRTSTVGPECVSLSWPESCNNWRVFFEWKTAGDYRVLAQIIRRPEYNDGQLFWVVSADNDGNCTLYYPPEQCAPFEHYWLEYSFAVPVPVGQWFKLEVFWHRSSGADGRVWAAIDGRVIADHYGANVGVQNAVINRIMLTQVYSSTASPIDQWVDDLQIWNGFPAAVSGDPWYDPPYAPH